MVVDLVSTLIMMIWCETYRPQLPSDPEYWYGCNLGVLLEVVYSKSGCFMPQLVRLAARFGVTTHALTWWIDAWLETWWFRGVIIGLNLMCWRLFKVTLWAVENWALKVGSWKIGGRMIGSKILAQWEVEPIASHIVWAPPSTGCSIHHPQSQSSRDRRILLPQVTDRKWTTIYYRYDSIGPSPSARGSSKTCISSLISPSSSAIKSSSATDRKRRGAPRFPTRREAWPALAQLDTWKDVLKPPTSQLSLASKYVWRRLRMKRHKHIAINLWNGR